MDLKAQAKINLGLDVVGRLENGYHEVRMVMQGLSLCDEVKINKTGSKGITVGCDNEHLSTGEDNLAYKAADLFRKRFGIAEGVDIFIKKRIPLAAGLAGGSSDAAAVIKGMNKLFKVNAPKEELYGLGVKIGADVPFCIMGGTAYAYGIGERLEKIKGAKCRHVLLAKPSFGVSTKEIYERVDEIEIKHVDIDMLIKSLAGGDIGVAAGHMRNVLEDVTSALHPEIRTLEEVMRAQGAAASMMSGSGPTVFGLFENEDALKAARSRIIALDMGCEVISTEF